MPQGPCRCIITYLVHPWCLLGASLVPPWCLLGASSVPPWCLLAPLDLVPGLFLELFWVPSPPPKGPKLIATERLRCHFDATWATFLPYGGRCRGLWSHFELTLGSLLAYENEFWMSMVSSYTHEAQFSKTPIFPMNFNGFWSFVGVGRHHNDPKLILICQK